MLRPWQPGTEISIRFVISLTFPRVPNYKPHSRWNSWGRLQWDPPFQGDTGLWSYIYIYLTYVKNSICISGYTCVQCVRVAREGRTCTRRANGGKWIPWHLLYVQNQQQTFTPIEIFTIRFLHKNSYVLVWHFTHSFMLFAKPTKENRGQGIKFKSYVSNHAGKVPGIQNRVAHLLESIFCFPFTEMEYSGQLWTPITKLAC